MNTTQNNEQHSSDYNLLITHKSEEPLPKLEFNLKDWELLELSGYFKRKYCDCVSNQLNINIYSGIYKVGAYCNRVEIPTFYGKMHYYKASIEEVLNPGTIIYNYNLFIKQFYSTELGKICYKLNNCRKAVMLTGSVSNMLKIAEDAYKIFVELFENKLLFTELYKNGCDEVIYCELEQVLQIWETGLCNVINHAEDRKVNEELDIMVGKYCSGNEYFKNNEGFLRHYDTQHINLSECIEACKVRLELIDLLKNDLENLEED